MIPSIGEDVVILAGDIGRSFNGIADARKLGPQTKFSSKRSDCSWACLVKNDPVMASFPSNMRTISHSQYYAVALMLAGYSLEVCLKAMLLLKVGIDQFMSNEKEYFHHDLNEISSFVPDLSEKDRAILKSLSHFIRWAGRYPDPGSRRLDNAVDIFQIAETDQITAKDLFDLLGRVMKHTQAVVG